jgi:hypothetical protein
MAEVVLVKNRGRARVLAEPEERATNHDFYWRGVVEQIVYSIQALRCWQCQRVLAPDEECRRRQMVTAVDHGLRLGRVNRYEVVNLCVACDDAWGVVAAEEQNQLWWRRFWFCVVAVSVLLSGFFTLGAVPLYGLIIWRLVWKWRARKRQRTIPPPAASARTPLAP